MKIVNSANIPELIHKFLSVDAYDHDANSLSATTLLKPIQEIILTKRHFDDIEISSEERIWSLFGSAIHLALEQAKLTEQQEERLAVMIGDKKVTGKFDVIYDGKLVDFKCTSVWTIIFDSRRNEWTRQLSIYRWLYWKVKGILLPDEASIIAILRDHSKRDALKRSDYPPTPIMSIPIELKSVEATEKWVTKRVKDIVTADKTNIIPDCTPEEQWWNEKLKKNNKCEKYCPCVRFCPQYKREAK